MRAHVQPDFRDAKRGEQGRLLGIISKGIVLECAGRVRRVPFSHLDKVTVCRQQPLTLSQGDKLQLKANSTALDGRKLANGEIVSVGEIQPNGAIRLDDGRTLPPSYRQFTRGYAVTSYGSQGKTVDHVLFADSGVRAASNAQQWYVSISRGRKGIKIFTPDIEQLRRSINRSGNRELALDFAHAPQRDRHVRSRLSDGIIRGKLARQLCRRAMQRWFANLLKLRANEVLHETPCRSPQSGPPVRTSMLAT